MDEARATSAATTTRPARADGIARLPHVSSASHEPRRCVGLPLQEAEAHELLAHVLARKAARSEQRDPAPRAARSRARPEGPEPRRRVPARRRDAQSPGDRCSFDDEPARAALLPHRGHVTRALLGFAAVVRDAHFERARRPSHVAVVRDVQSATGRHRDVAAGDTLRRASRSSERKPSRRPRARLVERELPLGHVQPQRARPVELPLRRAPRRGIVVEQETRNSDRRTLRRRPNGRHDDGQPRNAARRSAASSGRARPPSARPASRPRRTGSTHARARCASVRRSRWNTSVCRPTISKRSPSRRVARAVNVNVAQAQSPFFHTRTS